MAKTANGTTIGQVWYTQEESLEYTKEVSYVGQSGTTYYVYCLKFKLPAFSGKSGKISLGLSLRKYVSSEAKLRYALCTSDENCANYRWTTGEVTDNTQISAGYQTFSLTDSYTVCNIDIETDALEGDTEYYLYLWSGANNTLSWVNSKENHTITLTYKTRGGVRITTPVSHSKLHTALVYVNGAWKRHIPVVYTPNGWKRQG